MSEAGDDESTVEMGASVAPGSEPEPGQRAWIYYDLDALAGTGEYAVTIGRFDGVHLGHRHLIELMVASAKRQGLRSLAITFEPHPDRLLRPESATPRLTLPAAKAELLAATGVDAVAVLAFMADFARQQPEEFIARLVATARPREIWVGEDFAFGYRRAGTPQRLAEIGEREGFTVHRVARIDLPGGETIGSSVTREHLLRGEVAAAARLLGRPYALEGVVVHGAKRGRLLGYPTANLDTPAEALVPANGIYATLVDVPGLAWQHPAMTSIGVRPVFDNGVRLVEAHLLGWSGDLYDQPLRLHFLEWLRPEQNFPSVEALVEQMGHDGERTQEVVAARQLAATPATASDDPQPVAPTTTR